MKTKTAFLLLAVGLFILPAATCFQSQVGPDGKPLPNQVQQTGQAISSVAPILPSPWGGIVAIGGTLLTVIGSLFAKKQVNDAHEVGGEKAAAAVNPISKALAQRTWLFPLIGTLIAGGNALNLWHVDTAPLLTLLGALGIGSFADALKPVAGASVGAASPPAAPPPTPTP